MRTQSTILAILLAAASVFSHTSGPPQGTKPVMLVTYKVKPGQVTNFEALMKKYRDANEKAGRRSYMVWRGMMGDIFEFTALTEISGLDIYDKPSPLAQAFGERGALEVSSRLAMCLDGMTSQIWHLHPDQSIVSAHDFRFARANFVALRQDAVDEEVADPAQDRLGDSRGGRQEYVDASSRLWRRRRHGALHHAGRQTR